MENFTKKFNYVVGTDESKEGLFYLSLREIADVIQVNHSTISKKLSNGNNKCVVTSKHLKKDYYIIKFS